jgi:large subunit ribosomal protein L8e
MLTTIAEASRAKHKFAVKRNNWPKTRGVAMNPVDHPHGGVSFPSLTRQNDADADPHNRVTISTSVRPLPFHGTPSRDRRLVLLPPEGQVCSVVLRRQRSKVAKIHGLIGMVFSGFLTMDGTAQGRNLTWLLCQVLL